MDPEIPVVHEATHSWNRLTRLEWIVVIALSAVVAGMAAVGWFLLNASTKIDHVTRSTNAIVSKLDDNDARLRSQFSAQEAALRALKRSEDELAARIAELEHRQTIVLVREHDRQGKDSVIIVEPPPPSPQPTATVTCDPTPIIGNCRRGQK